MTDKRHEVELMLVDDHKIWRDGVKSLLEGSEFTIVAEASSGREAVELADRHHPEMVLLDIRMDGGDGLDTLHALRQKYVDMSIIMLTTYDNPTYMARAVAGGAAGYLLKGVDGDELLSALRAVADGEMLLSADDLMRSLRGVNKETSTVPDLVKPLSDRETEVLRLMATGLNNKAIASVLFISEATVKTHVEHIIYKIGVSDRVQAVVWAARHGVISLDKPSRDE